MGQPGVPDVPEVDPVDARARLAAGALLLDVREPDEWEAGHAPGASHVPLATLEEAAGGLPRDRAVVSVCRSGMRSARATAFLLGLGFDAVNLAGGMQAWAAAGLPVVDDDGADGRVA